MTMHLKQTFEAVILTEKFPKSQIDIYVEVCLYFIFYLINWIFIFYLGLKFKNGHQFFYQLIILIIYYEYSMGCLSQKISTDVKKLKDTCLV